MYNNHIFDCVIWFRIQILQWIIFSHFLIMWLNCWLVNRKSAVTQMSNVTRTNWGNGQNYKTRILSEAKWLYAEEERKWAADELFLQSLHLPFTPFLLCSPSTLLLLPSILLIWCKASLCLAIQMLISFLLLHEARTAVYQEVSGINKWLVGYMWQVGGVLSHDPAEPDPYWGWRPDHSGPHPSVGHV